MKSHTVLGGMKRRLEAVVSGRLNLFISAGADTQIITPPMKTSSCIWIGKAGIRYGQHHGHAWRGGFTTGVMTHDTGSGGEGGSITETTSLYIFNTQTPGYESSCSREALHTPGLIPADAREGRQLFVKVIGSVLNQKSKIIFLEGE